MKDDKIVISSRALPPIRRLRLLAAAAVVLLGVFCLTACGSRDDAPIDAERETIAKAEEYEKNTFKQSEETENDTMKTAEEREEMLEVGSVRLSVKEAGSGTDMILIHGRTLSKEDMDPLFDRYKERYHVVSYDVRGHGKTESGGTCTLDDLSDDLVGLIDAYQLEKPVVIGFSMGSYIALRTAERYPDLFSGIVLIGTRGKGHVSRFSISDEVADAMKNFDNMTDISKAVAPALVLTGENDFINPPEEGENVAKALPDAEFMLVPDAEHEAYKTNPDFVFEQTDIFLERLSLS